MTSSYADRLKARRSGGVKPNKGRTLKLNETKRIRGKIVYWNPYTKSWSKTKVVKKVEVKKEKPLTRAEKLKKDGFADLRGGKTKKKSEVKNNKTEVKKTETPKTKVETPKTEVKKEAPQEKLKVSYRRTKGEGIGKGDTRITKKLKKAGFTETRLAKLRKKHAEFKAKRKKKKK